MTCTFQAIYEKPKEKPIHQSSQVSTAQQRIYQLITSKMFNWLSNLNYVCYISRCKILIITIKKNRLQKRNTTELSFQLVTGDRHIAKLLPHPKLRMKQNIFLDNTTIKYFNDKKMHSVFITERINTKVFMLIQGATSLYPRLGQVSKGFYFFLSALRTSFLGFYLSAIKKRGQMFTNNCLT